MMESTNKNESNCSCNCDNVNSEYNCNNSDYECNASTDDNVDDIVTPDSKNEYNFDCEFTDDIDVPYQHEYDEYTSKLNYYFNEDEPSLADAKTLLKHGLSILEKYREDLKELEIYRIKFHPVRPLDMELSNLKKGYIGRCRCGQLLIENKHTCCPKCYQFIDWTKGDI